MIDNQSEPGAWAREISMRPLHPDMAAVADDYKRLRTERDKLIDAVVIMAFQLALKNSSGDRNPVEYAKEFWRLYVTPSVREMIP